MQCVIYIHLQNEEISYVTNRINKSLGLHCLNESYLTYHLVGRSTFIKVTLQELH